MNREPRADYMARKAIAEAHYAKHFGGIVAQVKAEREGRELGVSAEEKAALMRENFERCADGMFEDDRRERIAERERRLLGNY